MRFLLDEMHAVAAAEALRARDVDAVAVAERADLRSLPDPDVLAAGAVEARAVVTENVRDFAPLASGWASRGRAHAGIVFTHPRRFARSVAAYPGSLVAALAAFAEDPPVDGDSWVWWLHRGR